MISKQQIKTIHSLRLKKFRDESNLFLGEGPKVVKELLQSFSCTFLAATPSWIDANRHILPPGINCIAISADDLGRASLMDAPQQVLAIFNKKPSQLPSAHAMQSELCLALDTIQDPGNLGTIIRLARWFGIDHIVCSPLARSMWPIPLCPSGSAACPGIYPSMEHSSTAAISTKPPSPPTA